MKKATNIEEQKENAREFAKIIDKAYEDFHNTSLLKENGLKCFPFIIDINNIDDFIKKNNSINEREKISRKDFIPIRGGIQFFVLADSRLNVTSLKE